jgi:integrase
MRFTSVVGKVRVMRLAEVKAHLQAASPRLRLYYLLMLNTGALQADLTDLRRDEINFDLGTITRSRSKTGHRGGQEVTYPLWRETLALLTEHCQADGMALLTTKGKPLSNNRGTPRYDTIQSLHSQLTKREGWAVAVPLKRFRATAADTMDKHPTYGRFTDLFLAHSSKSMKDRHYANPDDAAFASAVMWLRDALKIGDVA